MYYLTGRHVKADADNGTAWLIAAADEEDAIAQLNLGAAKVQHHWLLDIKAHRDSNGGVELLLKSYAQGEPEAAYVLHSIVTHEIGVLSELTNFKGRFSEPQIYREILQDTIDRRTLLVDLLERGSDRDSAIAALNTVISAGHRVDRESHEPTYVVDAYLDNDHAIAELFKSVTFGKFETDVEISSILESIAYSHRSYNRFEKR